MIEVLYGKQYEIIEGYIKNYILSNKYDNVIKFDYKDYEISDIMNELQYSDLFGGKKLVILYNASFLTGKETLDDKEFTNYLNNPNPNMGLILVINEEKLDERKKIVKLIKDKYKVSEFNSFTIMDATKYVNDYFKKIGYKIEYNATKKIVERLSTNYGLYENELKKLEIYAFNTKEINLEMVNNIISRMPEDDVFKLVEAVMVNNKEAIFGLYKDLIELGSDDISLVGLLVSQFRFLYQVSVLSKDGKTSREIISLLHSHPYRTEQTIKKLSLFKDSDILDILYKLSLIDIELKSSNDKNGILENFFLEL